MKNAGSKNTAGLQLAMAGAVLAGGISLTGLGVHAAAADTGSPVGSGTLQLSLSAAGAGLHTPIDALAPGDSVLRHLVLDNVGTLAGAGLALHVDAASPSTLTTDAARGLQATVTTCSVAWSPATGRCPGTTGRPVSAAVATLIAGPVPVLGGLVPTRTYLQLRVALPESSENTVNGVLPTDTVQGLTASLTWNFTETRYAGPAAG